MDGAERIGPIWAFCRLDAAHRLEDLDDALEALLDAGGDVPAPTDASVRLAALLGYGVAEMERHIGTRLCDEVAAARIRLIEAAFAECQARARGTDEELHHALAVCAALQHEALGDVASGAAAFAVLDDSRKAPRGSVSRVFLSSLPLGARVALAVVRALTLVTWDAPGECFVCPISGSALAAE